MEGNAAKGLCMALLFVDTLLFGFPPYFLVRGRNQSPRAVRIRSTVISYLSCFGGGVFLGACLLHLLAEGREVMEKYFDSVGKHDIEFPVYEAVVAAGFFAIAIVEQIAHNLLQNSRHVRHSSLQAAAPSPRVRFGSFSLKRNAKTELSQQLGLDNPGYYKEMTHHADLTSQLSKPDTKPAEGLNNGYSAAVPSTSRGSVHKTYPNITSAAGAGGTDVIAVISSGNVTGEHGSRHSLDQGHVHREKNGHDPESGHDHDDEVVQMIKAMEVNPLRAFLLLGALSFHTIFDGLAVGLQDGGKHVWEMFTAICIHKSLVAVCLGLQLFLAFKSKPGMAFLWVFVFSLISPIGVGIGMAISSGAIDEQAEDLTNWILQGMATGTFLYVTIFEILHEELSKKDGILKIFVTVIGFGGMAVAKYFDQD